MDIITLAMAKKYADSVAATGGNASNYYTKSETDARISTVVTAQVTGAVDAALASQISVVDDSKISELVDLFN
ncbi:hypothetical protein FACS189499_03970 [Clostridia bacterium]|nr:hypothetical protein FACS189499_03970 [Clostridia bacterium]